MPRLPAPLRMRSLNSTELDEIQNIVQGVVLFMRALATAFNENDSLLVVFTGSYAGVLRKLFETSPSDEPYGRPPVQITVSPWPEFTALDFLRTGLKECGVEYNDNELGMALWKLGTLPGGLTSMGLGGAWEIHMTKHLAQFSLWG